MQIPPEKASDVKLPFVQYRLPPKEGMLGHFVLCIPQQEHVLILDGPKEPRLISCTMLRQEQEGIWDGTLLLIQTQRQEYLERLLTEQISWQAAIHAAYAWFVKEDADVSKEIEKISAYYAELSQKQMQNIKGGCPLGSICAPNKQVCKNIPTCKTAEECDLADRYCADETIGKSCQPGNHWWQLCINLNAHNCDPQQHLTGACENGVCTVYQSSGGTWDCGSQVSRCIGASGGN